MLMYSKVTLKETKQKNLLIHKDALGYKTFWLDLHFAFHSFMVEHVACFSNPQNMGPWTLMGTQS